MNIIFTASNKFFKPAKVMIDSLLRHNNGVHNIFFMYNTTKVKYRKKIRKIVEKNGSKYNEIFMDKELFSNFPIYKRFGYELYFRLLMPYILPDNINKILCIDSDMTINKSLEEVYNQDFDDCYMMAAPSPNEKENININSTKQYVGGGFVIYNVTKIKKDFNKEFIVESFVNNYDKYPYLDQDFINCFYDGKIKKIDSEYNHIIFRNIKYDNKEIALIMNNVIVAHFPGQIKPWDYIYGNRTYKIYWKEAKITLGYHSYMLYKILFYCLLPLQVIIKQMRKRKKTNFK